jgi:glucose-1-phosphate thymidylyltransferase
MKNTKMKGIILAGGNGSRIYPLSKIYSKQLISVFDKPMIYYPFSTLISAGINEILIISNQETLNFYKKLFGNGSNLGLLIDYAVQEKPNGIAESFIIGKSFIQNDNVSLILGDNIFYGTNEIFKHSINNFNNNFNNELNNTKANIFALAIKKPENYGVIRFSDENIPLEIIEKPQNFVSNYVIPGFYIYDSSVVEIAENLKPSARNELEITDINNFYLQNRNLNVIKLHSNVTWFDCGTPKSLLNASNFVASIEERHFIKLGCPEEAALKMNFINKQQFLKYINDLPICEYQNYLAKISGDL